jgi:stage IV sporulation protein FB
MESGIPIQAPFPPKPDEPQPGPSRFNPVRTLLSLLIYIAVYYAIFRDLKSVIFLVIVILIHEMGHFVAMKIFGYNDVKMFFVPFLGAFVSGNAKEISLSKKAIMILAGPVPGIILGLICLWLFVVTRNTILYQFALLFLFLNVFNLLPVSPMDGGQLLETLYFHSSKIVQTIFIALSCIAIIYLAIQTGNYVLLIIVLLLINRLRYLYRFDSIKKRLSQQGISLEKTYEQLSDREYWETRKVLIEKVPALRDLNPNNFSENESSIISWVKAVLVKPVDRYMNLTKRTIFTLVWFVALVAPIIAWLYYTLIMYLAE